MLAPEGKRLRDVERRCVERMARLRWLNDAENEERRFERGIRGH